MRSPLVTVCLFLVLAGAAEAAPRTVSGAARVMDGDSLVIKGVKVRLFGIDAFEAKQTCGRMACGIKATVALEGIVAKQTVTCERQDTDDYGRMVAICKTSGGVDLGREMVRRGLAVAYRSYSTRYLPDEAWAKRNRQGAWAHGFDSPITWRRTHPRK